MFQSIGLKTFFVLHSRPYRDTSLLLDVFSRDLGRLSCIAKGARRIKSRQRSLLQPFVGLSGQFMGKSELQAIYQVEISDELYRLSGNALYSGFYLNELLVYLLPKLDPHPDLFDCYQQTIYALAYNNELEKSLRLFELTLLKELGYAIQFMEDTSGNKIIENNIYYFDPAHGFKLNRDSHLSTMSFTGKHLLMLSEREISNGEAQQSCKRITRIALHHLLGHKTLKSRELLMSLK